jgi:hypothetical protein
MGSICLVEAEGAGAECVADSSLAEACESSLPPSVSHQGVAFAGVATTLAGMLFYRYQPPSDMRVAALLLVMACSAIYYALEIVWLKTHWNPSTGLDLRSPFNHSLSRTCTKYFGLLGTLGSVSILYWLFPIYRGNANGDFYSVCWYIVPVWLILAPPYFYFLDGAAVKKEDGFWQAGALLCRALSLGRCEGSANVDLKALWQHALGWIIKAFFLPMMFGAMCKYVS